MFLGFGDSSLNFELRFWTREFEDWMRVRSEAGEIIIHKFREVGIEIPFPQRDLHVRSGLSGTSSAAAAPGGSTKAASSVSSAFGNTGNGRR